MITDEVVNPVRSCQESILGNVASLIKANEKQDQRLQRSLQREWNFPTSSAASPGESSFINLMIADSRHNIVYQSDDDSWLEVVTSPPTQDFSDLVRRPRAFIAAASPAMLQSQLSGIHAGQALITIALNRAADAGKFGDLCTALMNGTLPLGPAGEIVRGRLLVSDTGNVLPEAAREAGDKTAWLGRLLWLVSGNAGPELSLQQAREGNVVRLPSVAYRFSCAAQRIFANRMNDRTARPLIYKMDFDDHQARWMTFLQGMESRLPGITGTARLLLASLVFGLRRIIGVDKLPEGFEYRMAGIEALARFLVHRMANARAAILFSAEEAQKLLYKQKILTELSVGCLENRDIYRLLRRPAAICVPILLEMVTEGLLTRRGNKWELTKGAALPGKQYLPLPLEV